jgi:hypothetical protein
MDRRPIDPELDIAGPSDNGLGVGDDPLRPGEAETYRTDHSAASDSEATPPAADSRGWFVVGLVLLGIFVAILLWAVLVPLL